MIVQNMFENVIFDLLNVSGVNSRFRRKFNRVRVVCEL